MLLRLKGESKGDAEDEIPDEELLTEPSDLIADEDGLPGEVLPEDLEDDEGEAGGFLPPVPGPLIAAATFVPTFLAIFFGLSHLLGAATQPAHTANAPAQSATSDLGAQVTPPRVENAPPPAVVPSPLQSLLPPLVTLPPADPPTAAPSGPPPVVTLPPADPPAAAPSGQPPVATLPPAEPPAVATAPESRAARSGAPSRPPQPAVLTITPERTPAAGPRTSGRDWTPAAAFADREAAGRLASSIQQQGYPVEIRQEQSSARPWVVWIGAQPRGGERRR